MTSSVRGRRSPDMLLPKPDDEDWGAAAEEWAAAAAGGGRADSDVE
jgi:hypothetical protein